jgi:hypothetical protein
MVRLLLSKFGLELLVKEKRNADAKIHGEREKDEDGKNTYQANDGLSNPRPVRQAGRRHLIVKVCGAVWIVKIGQA